MPGLSLYPTKVVLTEGRNGAPARLVVAVDLGHGFAALPPVLRREAIERALADALTVAEEKATPAETSAEDVACQDQPADSEPAPEFVAA